MPNYITHQDDSRIPEGLKIRTLKSGRVSYKRWMLPIDYGHVTLREGNDFLKIVAAPQGEIPEIIRWTEGKDSHLVKAFFYGGVDLQAHDFIHLLLGRGLLPKDEAFVIGFTMGSTNRLATMNQEVFAYIAQHYYPNAYQMDAESRIIFMDAAKLGYLSDCQPLDQIDFKPFLDKSIDEVRKAIGLHPKMIEAYYRDIEQRRHPEDPASSRLVDAKAGYNPWIFEKPVRQECTLQAVAQATKAELVATDQTYHFKQDAFTGTLTAARDEALRILSEQKEVAHMCFKEIENICGENDENVKRDQELKVWDTFFQQAEQSVHDSHQAVIEDMEHSLWEKQDEAIGNRAYVHALLNRGCSPRDRAFCRGFYDGSSNKKSSYAADMKAQVLADACMTRDGRYTADMMQSYQDGVRMGFISDATPFNTVDLKSFADTPLAEARKALNLTTTLFEAYHKEVESVRPE